MYAIVLDTETTGIGGENHPIEVGYIHLGNFPENPEYLLTLDYPQEVKRFRASVPINPGAKKVHGISERDIAHCPDFSMDLIPFPEGTQYIIGHNIKFDIDMTGVQGYKEICTLKLCRKLYPEYPRYALSVIVPLMFPEADKTLLASAHGAITDCKLCILTLHKILNDFEFDSWEALHEFSERGEKVKG